MSDTSGGNSRKRVQRVERQLFETLSNYLLHGLSQALPCFASITAVEVNTTLRHAKVFFRLIGNEKQTSDGQKMLDGERSSFQREVAKNIESKFCPVLAFKYGVADKRDEIDELFDNLRKPKHQFGD
jgi:ribosome-binding factor A